MAVTIHKSPIARPLMLLFIAAGFAVLGGTVSQAGFFAPTPVAAPPPVGIVLTSPRAHDTKLIVDLSDRSVQIYRHDRRLARYPIAVGQPGWETPLGAFPIHQMREHPEWQHPITHAVIPAGADDNPLGDRWIGFQAGEHMAIGFHGTPNESLVGSAVSHGCLRMRNRDIRNLYQQVGLGTIVEVRQ
jgi:L,D-transpeptidase ErfK/SrfK